jgi:hypothetical protein
VRHLILAVALASGVPAAAAEPPQAAAPARFTFVDAFGPEAGAAPHYRPVTLGGTPPRPLADAPAAGPGTFFALARVGTGPSAALGLVWQPDAPRGPVLWLDADGDGRLAASERHAFPGKTLEVPARVSVSGVALPRTLIFRRGPGTTLFVAVRGYTAGKLRLAGREFAAALTDGDADGCFDSAGVDRVWIDLDGDGAFDPLTEQFPLGTPIEAGGGRFLIRPDPSGTEVRVRARGSETGRLRPTLPLQPGAVVREVEANLVSEFGELATVRSLGVAVELPAGMYRVEGLTVQVADAKGRVWTFRFRGQRRFVLGVETGKETAADLLAGLKFSAGVDAESAVAGEEVLVSPTWETAAGVYLAECTVNGTASGAEIVLSDGTGKALDRAESGFA